MPRPRLPSDSIAVGSRLAAAIFSGNDFYNQTDATPIKRDRIIATFCSALINSFKKCNSLPYCINVSSSVDLNCEIEDYATTWDATISDMLAISFSLYARPFPRIKLTNSNLFIRYKNVHESYCLNLHRVTNCHNFVVSRPLTASPKPPSSLTLRPVIERRAFPNGRRNFRNVATPC